MTRAVVLDIEGTTSPLASVRQALYQYFRRHLDSWLAAGDVHSLEVAEQTRRRAGDDGLDVTAVARLLHRWLDEDVKSDLLKEAQGHVCHIGFSSGELQGVFFPDVRPALRAWTEAGLSVHVYSSGSELNQRDWFEYAAGGSLSNYIGQYFDLSSAGPKTSAESYRTISRRLDVAGADIVFLTDSEVELDAASRAGWRVIGVAREPGPLHQARTWTWLEDFGQFTASLASAQIGGRPDDQLRRASAGPAPDPRLRGAARVATGHLPACPTT